MSLHAIAGEVDGAAVTDAHHERIRRRALGPTWHNLVVAARTPWAGGNGFIVGGDWNNAVLFDTVSPLGAEGGSGASSEFSRVERNPVVRRVA